MAKKKIERVGLRDNGIFAFNEHEIKELSETFCPLCGDGPLDGASQVKESNDAPACMPNDGDINVCFYCGGILVYHVNKGTISLQAATDEKLNELKKYPQLWHDITKIQFAIKMKKKS